MKEYIIIVFFLFVIFLYSIKDDTRMVFDLYNDNDYIEEFLLNFDNYNLNTNNFKDVFYWFIKNDYNFSIIDINQLILTNKIEYYFILII